MWFKTKLIHDYISVCGPRESVPVGRQHRQADGSDEISEINYSVLTDRYRRAATVHY